MEVIKCSECGKKLNQNSMVCPNCGYKNQIITCPNCGTKVSDTNIRFCPKCGNKILKHNLLKKPNVIIGGVLVILILIISIFIIFKNVNNATNVLECSLHDGVYSRDIKLTFEDKKLIELKSDTNIKKPQSYDAEYESVYENLYEKAINLEGMSSKINNSGLEINAIIETDGGVSLHEKINPEYDPRFIGASTGNIISSEMSKEEMKSALEADGYTCN